MAFQGRVAGGRIRQLSSCDRLVPSVDLVELKIPLEDCAADLGPESPAEPLIALQDGDEGDTTDEEATPIEDTDVGVELPGASLLLRAAALPAGTRSLQVSGAKGRASCACDSEPWFASWSVAAADIRRVRATNSRRPRIRSRCRSRATARSSPLLPASTAARPVPSRSRRRSR